MSKNRLMVYPWYGGADERPDTIRRSIRRRIPWG